MLFCHSVMFVILPLLTWQMWCYALLCRSVHAFLPAVDKNLCVFDKKNVVSEGRDVLSRCISVAGACSREMVQGNIQS